MRKTFTVCLLVACSTTLPSRCGPPPITVTNLHLHEIANKKTTWDLTAHKSQFSKSGRTIRSKQVTCRFTQGTEQIAQIKAAAALIKRSKKLIKLQGAVHGTFQDLQFDGHDLDYLMANDQIKTKKRVAFTHPQFTLTAKKGLLKLGEKKLYLRGNVVTHITLAPPAQAPAHQPMLAAPSKERGPQP